MFRRMPYLATSLSYGIIVLWTSVQAQLTCDGSAVPPQSYSMLQRYPKVYEIASLVPGDQDAHTMFQMVLSSKSSALSYSPTSNSSAFKYDTTSDPNCYWTETRCTSPKVQGLPEDLYTCPTPETWGLCALFDTCIEIASSLTFDIIAIDDGPTCYHTPMYNMLRQQNQLASLYYIGSNAVIYPLETQRGFLDRHEICVHTWSHPHMTQMTNEQAFAELYYTKKAIKELTGYSPRCWRPPYGDVDDRIRTIAEALDLRTHVWDHDTTDWMVSSLGIPAVNRTYDTILQTDVSRSGIVVLTHELNEETVSLFIEHMPAIVQRFQHITPVSTCNNDTDVFAEDGSPSFPDFADYVAGSRPIRNDSAFWSTDDVVFEDGIIASFADSPSSSFSFSSLSSTSVAASSTTSFTSATTAPVFKPSASPSRSSARIATTNPIAIIFVAAVGFRFLSTVV